MRLPVILLAAAGLLAAAPLPAPPAVRPYPRMHIDPVLLAQIRALRTARDPLWTRFENYVRPMPSTTAFPASVVNSYLLAYLVTGEPRYFEGAWKILRQGVYVNGRDRSGGRKALLAHFGDTHAAAFLGAQYIALVAQLYDWCLPRLSAEEREDIIAWINRVAEYEYRDNPDGRARFRNDGAAVVYGLMAGAYGTLGENPRAPEIYGWFRELWEETLRCLDIMGKGGASGEGNGYGISPTGFSFIRIANLAHYASGEDLFASHPWFRQRLLYDAFSALPSPTGGPASPVPEGWPGMPAVEIAMMGGDGRRGISQESRDVRVRQNGLILARRFAGTQEAAVWNRVFRAPEVDQAVSDVESYADLLYYSPRPRLALPARLSHFDPSMGFVYVRSSWDADATWIAFWAGPHLDTHQHLDQGAFSIFKRRDLAPRTGHYDLDIRGGHQLAWYTRTIGSNGLLVGDPHEAFQGFIGGGGCDAAGNGSKVRATDGEGAWCVPNDGGERTMRPFSLAPANSRVFLENRHIFDVARVVHFHDDGTAVSVVADLTHAYNSPRYATPGNAAKVKRVYRRLVYLRGPDILLVADTVESTNPAFEKKWLIHALDRIEVGGEVTPVAPGESVHAGVSEARILVDDSSLSDARQPTFDLRRGYAGLLVKTLFPTDFRYRKIGGREPADTPHAGARPATATHFHRHVRDFWVKDYSEGVLPFHKSMNWPPEQPIETSVPSYVSIFGPGYGRWRLEVEPVGRRATDYFLSVLKPSLDPRAVMPSVERLETAAQFGAEIRRDGRAWQVLFDKDGLAAPVVEAVR